MQQRANGVLSDYGWDSISRLSGLSHDLSGTANDAAFVYAYNPANRIVSRQGIGPAYQAARPYEYTVATYDGLNRVTSLNGQPVGYNDGRGSVTYLPPRAQQPGRDFAYDAERQLTYATPYSYSDDALGRLGSASGPAARRFQHDGEQLATETGVDTITVLTRHVPTDVLNATVATFESGNTSSPVWPITDERGSVIALTDSNGFAGWFTTYDEYGQVIAGGPSRFGYAGQVQLQSDLQDIHARNYVPSIGRFLQTDPIGYAAGANLYAYVGGDPVNAVDPLGLDPISNLPRQVEEIVVTARRLQQVIIPDPFSIVEDQLRRIGRYGTGSGSNGSSGDQGSSTPRGHTCPAGQYTQVSLGGGGTVALVIPGVGASGQVGISFPPGNELRGAQVYGGVQMNLMLGIGAFAGYGASAGFGRTSGRLPTIQASVPLYGEANIGWGPSIGGSIQRDRSSQSASVAIPGLPGRAGVGAGAYVGGGIAPGVQVGSPPLGCH